MKTSTQLAQSIFNSCTGRYHDVMPAIQVLIEITKADQERIERLEAKLKTITELAQELQAKRWLLHGVQSQDPAGMSMQWHLARIKKVGKITARITELNSEIIKISSDI